MGTRADFYVGRGENAEWLGSIAWDGYPVGVADEMKLDVDSEEHFRGEVSNMLASREDGTTPEMGWPWPWNDSQTSDYAYAFDTGKVHASCFGNQWFDPLNPPEDDDEKFEGNKVDFPDMSKRKRVTLGKRSGVMVFTAKT